MKIYVHGNKWALAWTGIVSVIVLGVGILGSTFGKEKE
jgi:hypothetical protein